MSQPRVPAAACAARLRRHASSLTRAVAEALEARRLLAAPLLGDPQPRDQRSDYISSGVDLGPVSRFEWEYSGQRLVYDFDQPVDVQRQHLVLTRLNDGAVLPAGDAVENATGFAEVETFAFPEVPGTPVDATLPNGNYEAILRGGANGPANALGELLAQENVTAFYVLHGDANRNRTVDGGDYSRIDFAILFPGAAGYFNGDFNYDGYITGDDYSVIDFAYGTAMPAPPATANSLVAYASRGRGRIDLSWTAPLDMTGVDGFRIFRSTDGGDQYVLHATVADPAARSWFETGLADGTKYHYRVRPYNTVNGNGVTTNEAWAVTNLPGPGELIATAVSPTAVNLNWTDNTDAETAYQVWQSTAGGAYVLVDTLPANEEQGPMVYQRAGLSPGTTYGFRVRAISAAQTSIFTLSATVTTPLASRNIGINNAGFEQPALAAGASSSPVPGWTFTTNSADGHGKVMNPVGSSEWDAQAVEGNNVAWMTTSDWGDAQLSQTLTETLQPNTTYRLTVAVGSPDAWQPLLFKLYAGETELTQTWGSFPVAGSDNAFLSYTGFEYTAGTQPELVGQPLKIVLISQAGDNVEDVGSRIAFDDIRLVALTEIQQVPHGGTPHPVPGLVEFEDFDEGGEGVSYHDLDEGNRGGVYRLDEDADVDIARDETGSYLIGWAKPTEWVEYTVNVPTAGTFDLTSYVAAPGPGGTFHWEIDGASVGAALQVPDTGGYYNYQPVPLAGVALSAGTHVLRLCLDTAGTFPSGSVGNFNYFTLSDPAAVVAAPTGFAALADVFPNRVDLAWTRPAGNNETGYRIERSGDGGSTWTWVADVRAGATTYAVQGLTPGTAYDFRIAAANGQALSSWAQTAAAVTTPSAMTFPYRVNFQLEGTLPVPGYLADSGDVFAYRGNGLSYGWNSGHNLMDRDRHTGIDRRLDTLVHFYQGGEWSIDVPDGTYDVKVSIGDASFPSTHTINVNGVNYWTTTSLAAGEFVNGTRQILVTDGKIKLDQGTAADKATRINYIEIAPATPGPVPVARITASASAAEEAGPVATTYTVTLDRPAPAGGLAIAYETTTSTTAEAGDYQLNPAGSVTIAQGATTGTITLTPQQDVDSDDEILVLRLLDGVDYDIATPFSASATIIDDGGGSGTPSADLDLFEDANGDGLHDNSPAAEQQEATQSTSIPLISSGERAKLALVLRNVVGADTVTFNFNPSELTLYRDPTGTDMIPANSPVGVNTLGLGGSGTGIIYAAGAAEGALSGGISISLGGVAGAFGAFTGGIIAADGSGQREDNPLWRDGDPTTEPNSGGLDDGDGNQPLSDRDGWWDKLTNDNSTQKNKDGQFLIIGFAGHTQSMGFHDAVDQTRKGRIWNVNPNSGTYKIGEKFKQAGYPVQLFPEDPGNDDMFEVVNPQANPMCGDGVLGVPNPSKDNQRVNSDTQPVRSGALEFLVDAIKGDPATGRQGKRKIGLFGYSHGGGSLEILIRALVNIAKTDQVLHDLIVPTETQAAPVTFFWTGYIDAVAIRFENNETDTSGYPDAADNYPLTRADNDQRVVGTMRHFNVYQHRDLPVEPGGDGVPLAGKDLSTDSNGDSFVVWRGQGAVLSQVATDSDNSLWRGKYGAEGLDHTNAKNHGIAEDPDVHNLLFESFNSAVAALGG